MSGKIPITGAQQPISAIAAGDSAVTPPSLIDNGWRCENANVLRIIKMAMNRTKQQPCHVVVLVDFIIQIVMMMSDEIGVTKYC